MATFKIKKPIVLIGVGEMGGVFAHGFLRLGYPIYPVTRVMALTTAAAACPAPEMVLVAVAESDLRTILEKMPPLWADRLCLLQNELLPRDWAQFQKVTLVSVWFEKKKGQGVKVILPTLVFGPHQDLVAEALRGIDIPVRRLDDEEELLFELVLKNLYILTSNLCGLKTGGTVGELWSQHQAFARQVANEVIDIQAALTTGEEFDRERLIQGMLCAIEEDPTHKCMGRKAPARLARAIAQADSLGLGIPTLRELRGN